jgi:beta-glucanase (GH16 family)
LQKKETFTDQDVTKQYTSARLSNFFKYGRIDVRKSTSEAGTWPAIWMLGKNVNEDGGILIQLYGTANWPAW